MKRISKKILAAKKIAPIWMVVALGSIDPARAGIPVIDAANLVQTIMSASENVAQTLKQIEQYQTQLQQYENMLQNTAAPSDYIWDQAMLKMGELRRAIDTLNDYKNQVGSLFAMVLIIGVAASVMDQYYQEMGEDIRLKELAVVLVVAFIMAMLVKSTPPLISGIVTGAGVGHGGGVSFGAGTLLGAGAMATATMAMGAAGVAAGAANAAGGAQALMAAFSKASAAAGNGGTGDVAGASASGAWGGSLASAMDGGSPNGLLAKAGKIAAGTAANLAQGSWSVAETKAASIREAAADRVNETTGGKIAAAIREDGMFFDEGYISTGKGEPSAPAADEVAAFVGRDSGNS
jgi:type IV secretion system protein TrbL